MTPTSGHHEQNLPLGHQGTLTDPHLTPQNINKALSLSISYLILLITLKIKILSRYQFLWPRIFLQTKEILPENIGYINPFFYLDDIFIAFMCFLIFAYLFSKNNTRLNRLVYITYILISIYSILNSIIFYKYGVQINLPIIYQIDSLYTMKTSIDTELHENYRLIMAIVFLLVLSFTGPILMTYVFTFITNKYNLTKKIRLKLIWTILSLISIILFFTIKNYHFKNEILTETPLTSLSKSLASHILHNINTTNKDIPDFDDRIFSSSEDTKNTPNYISEKYRKKYNVILIVLETTSNHLVNPSGALAHYLPNLKKLAKKGLYLPNFFTPFPRSAKAFFAIQTGFYPLTDYNSLLRIAPKINLPTIFSVLKDHKYNTFAAYSGDFNYDRMADFLAVRKVDRLVDKSENDGSYEEISWGVDDELIYNKLIDWIDSLGYASPFFAFLLPINTHHPFWTPKEEYKIVPEHDQMSRYINAIHYQDFLIGKLIDFLENTNRLQNTIIIVTGDHGTVFNALKTEQNRSSPYTIDRNSINVPFYLYFDSSNTVKFHHDIIGSHIDIFPTILDLVGIQLETKLQGRSLFDPTINNRVSFIYNDYNHKILIALTKQWFLFKDINQSNVILSKNFYFDVNYCEIQSTTCSLLLNKLHEFEQFQNKRLLTHFQ